MSGTRIASRHRSAFSERFERDQAAEMTNDKWDEWVNALPVHEFMAMISLKTKETTK